MSDRPAPIKISRREWLLGGLGIASAAGAGVLTAKYLIARRAMRATTTVALVYPEPRALPPFHLTEGDGSAFDAGRLAGRYSFLVFGYTNCPDVCPTTLLELKHVRTLLADLPATLSPAVVLVTVDPKRDTAAVVGEYAHHFDPTFTGVTGDVAAIDAFALAAGVAILRGAEKDGSYSVDHTAAIFLVDPSARITALFPTPHQAAAIAADYRAIVARAGVT